MNLQQIVTTSESEASLRGHVAAYLEAAGYRPVSVHPFLVYQRGSLLSSVFALSPKNQRAKVSVEIRPGENQANEVYLSLEAKTEGEFVLDRKGDFWQKEFDGLVAAASTGADDGAPATATLSPAFDLKQVASTEAGVKLRARLSGGASWFYVIGALSLVNSLIYAAGGSLNFVVGLGITQIVDGFASGFAKAADTDVATVIAVAIDIGFAGLFGLFGFLAKKRHQWAFVAGMTLYALDALIFLFVQDYLSIAFHAFALFGLFNGLKAGRELDRLQQAASPATP